MSSLVSIVIPTFNEEKTLERNLRSLQDQGEEIEIVVADGGSSDRTRAIASQYGRCVVSAKGRGTQMNAGAAWTRGEFLLFLHADSWIEPHAVEEVREILSTPGAKAGCFPQRIEARAPVYRMVEWAASFRALRLGIVYGDCGLFLRRETFEQCGRFPDVPLFEDFGISQRLKKIPGRIVQAKRRVHVSARRWQERGFLRTTMLNWNLVFSYLQGTSAETLAQRYEQK